MQGWRKQDLQEKIDFLSIGNKLTDREKEAYSAGHTEGFNHVLSILKIHYGLEVIYK